MMTTPKIAEPVVDVNDVSHISSGTIIKGEVSSLTDIRIDGHVEGEVYSKGKIVVGDQAGETYIRYHLVASAPYLSSISNGSTVLPTCLDIFFPFLSRIRSLTSTFLYGDCPLTKVAIAMRE